MTPTPPAPTDRATTVLVAEDDADLLALAARILVGAGHRVLTASDGTAAVARWHAEGPVDVLFTDLVMPGLDGVGVAQALRAERADLPVVFTTGQAGEATLQAVAAMGQPLLPKPYTPAQLCDAVDSVLAGGRGGGTAP